MLNTWKAILISDPDMAMGNRNIASFISATETSATPGTMACERCQHKCTPLLAVAYVTKKMKIYFHISNLGVTRTLPSDKSDNVISATENVTYTVDAMDFDYPANMKKGPVQKMIKKLLKLSNLTVSLKLTIV